MKRIFAKTTLVIATLSVLGMVPGAQAAEDKPCSNATLSGSFGYTVTGTTFDTGPVFSGPFGAVGRQTFDGKGNTSGSQTTSLNGHILALTYTGTYTVHPDCTGSLTIHLSIGVINNVYFVINSDGAEFRAINTDGGGVLTTVGRKQFSNE
jgi:hypothetical protein